MFAVKVVVLEEYCRCTLARWVSRLTKREWQRKSIFEKEKAWDPSDLELKYCLNCLKGTTTYRPSLTGSFLNTNTNTCS